MADATTVTVTRNEILTALNKPEDFILAIGQIENGRGKLLYIRQPFQLEPEFSVESVNYKLQELLNRGEGPGMIAALDPVDGLEVSHHDLSKAIGIVSRLVEKWNKGVSLRFEDGWLFIEAGHGHAVAKAPARGCWPLTIIVGFSWVRRLAKNMPAGDPIRLRVHEGRLYANRYSEPCSLTSQDGPLHPEVPGMDEKAVILEAAKILKPLRASIEKPLRSLVSGNTC